MSPSSPICRAQTLPNIKNTQHQEISRPIMFQTFPTLRHTETILCRYLYFCEWLPSFYTECWNCRQREKKYKAEKVGKIYQWLQNTKKGGKIIGVSKNNKLFMITWVFCQTKAAHDPIFFLLKNPHALIAYKWCFVFFNAVLSSESFKISLGMEMSSCFDNKL